MHNVKRLFIQKGRKSMLQLGKEIMIFDGGMGSELEKTGISFKIPEDLNVTHSDIIKGIHLSYSDADFITTNTFGLNKIKYKGSYPISLLCEKAIENARATGKRVMFDIGPTGMLLKPLGTLDFDDAYEAYKEVVLCSKDNVDGYIIETFSDLYELKAALLAVKDNSDKPVIVTMTFDKSGRTLTGTSPEIMIEFLEAVGVTALGVNCSLGPKELYGVVEKLASSAHIPVIVQPNRGLPKVENGRTCYDITADEFKSCVADFVKMGVSIIGGCCGTDPSFISAISELKGTTVTRRDNIYKTAATSYSRITEINSDTVFGDTISPDPEDIDLILDDAMDQQDEEVDVITLKVDEDGDIIRRCLEIIQECVSTPICIISDDDGVLEKGVRYYNGLPLIGIEDKNNSDGALAVAAKFGATVRCCFENDDAFIKKAVALGVKEHKIVFM